MCTEISRTQPLPLELSLEVLSFSCTELFLPFFSPLFGAAYKVWQGAGVVLGIKHQKKDEQF